MKRIRIIAIISAIVTAFAFYFYLASMKKPETITRVPVVVAVKEIPEGLEITSDMVAIKEVPVEAIVSMAASRLDMIVGYISSADVKPEEQLLVTKVFKAGETKSGLSYAVDKGMRAFTVPVDSETGTGVSGFLRPKDRVDVLVIFETSGLLSPKQFKEMLGDLDGKSPEDSESSEATEKPATTTAPEGDQLNIVYSMILLQNIKVLATDQVMKADDSNTDPKLVDTVTLSVTPEQALRLNMALSEAKAPDVKRKIRLVLRAPDEPVQPELEGTFVVNLINTNDIQALTLFGQLPSASPRPTASPAPTASLAPTATPAATKKPKK